MGFEHLPSGKLRDILKHPGYTLEEWPHVDQGELSQKDRENFASRRKAVHMYADGSPGSEIRRITGVRLDYLVRLIRDRCLMTHDGGRNRKLDARPINERLISVIISLLH